MAGSSQQMGSTASSPMEFIDLSEYDSMSFQSPSISPSTNKMQFARPTPSLATTPTTMPPSQMLSGPSHQYDQYKQQTPFVPGALANTLAINDGNVPMTGYNMDFLSPGDEMFDFNSQNSIPSDNMDLQFESGQADFLLGATPNINPRTITAPSPVASQTSNPGRVYPGYHSQRMAVAKAQAQQQQQIQMLRSQMSQPNTIQQSTPPQPKTAEPEDPLVQQKISELLSSMRSKASLSSPEDNSPLTQISRQKKEEEEMDEDERLLASEAGKKLTSKERRQLRNKVSARAFRSRRKEYINHLEAEVGNKVKENGDLRAENLAVKEENKRLSELCQMLLRTQHFQGFLNDMTTNSASHPQPKPRVEQQQVKNEPNHVLKDPNPYNATNMGQQQQIGMVMMPEQSINLGMVNVTPDFNYPGVFAVLETPDLPEIDTDALMGKSSNFVGALSVSDSDKVALPSLEAPIPSMVEKSQQEETLEPAPVDQKAPNLDGDIFDEDEQLEAPIAPLELDTDGLSAVDMFGGIEPEKAFARYDLVDSSEEDVVAAMSVRRVERLAANLAATISRLERLDIDL